MEAELKRIADALERIERLFQPLPEPLEEMDDEELYESLSQPVRGDLR